VTEIFDDWPDKYDQWFETPMGELVRVYESGLIQEMLRPETGEHILDAGCGTGVFTRDLLEAGASVTGLDLSLPMLRRARRKASLCPFRTVQGDLSQLPFGENVFDKAVSVTAIEFIEDGKGAVRELFRVTRPGGRIIVASLNRLSPWAIRRKEAAGEGHPLFRHARFRSPEEMAALAPVPCVIKTAIHFLKHDDPQQARIVEENGQTKGLDTGAFLVVQWEKPQSRKEV
jgi:ubiquinone/menaquinone biosynthesis C-methylase UbiE